MLRETGTRKKFPAKILEFQQKKRNKKKYSSMSETTEERLSTVVRTFNVPGTFSVPLPDGVASVAARLTGGGGGGASGGVTTPSVVTSAGGGGGAATIEETIPVQSGCLCSCNGGR